MKDFLVIFESKPGAAYEANSRLLQHTEDTESLAPICLSVEILDWKVLSHSISTPGALLQAPTEAKPTAEAWT